LAVNTGINGPEEFPDFRGILDAEKAESVG